MAQSSAGVMIVCRGLGVGVSLFALLLSWTLAAGLHHTLQVLETRLPSPSSV